MIRAAYWNSLAVTCVWAALLLATPGPATAQNAASVANLQALLERYRSEMVADKYEKAEVTAKTMLAISEANLQNRPDVQAEFHDLLAKAYEAQDRYVEALPHRERQVALVTRASGADHASVATALHDLGDCHWYADQIEAATHVYERALALRTKIFGASHAETDFSRRELAFGYQKLERYADEEPLRRAALKFARAEYGANSAETAQASIDMGNCLWNQGNRDESLPLYEQALAARIAALGAVAEETLEMREELAANFEETERWDDALRVRLETIRVLEQKNGVDDESVLAELEPLGALHERRSKFDLAEAAYQRILKTREKTLAADDALIADALVLLADLRYGQGRYAESEAFARRSLSIAEKSFEADSPDLAYYQDRVASACFGIGKFSESEKLHKRILKIRESESPEGTTDLAFTLHALGMIYRDQGRYAEAEALFKRALRLRETLLGEDESEVADTLVDLAVSYSEQARHAEAEPLLQRSLRIRRDIYGLGSREEADSLYPIAVLYNSQGRNAEALPLAKQALANWEQHLSGEHPNVAMCLGLLGLITNQQGNPAEAEKLHQRSLALQEKIYGPDHLDLAYALHNLAAIYREEKRFDEAEKFNRRALAIREQALEADNPAIAYSLKCLAELAAAQKQFDQVELLVDRALLLLEQRRSMPETQFECLQLRAEAAWRTGHKTEAVADLRRAFELAEQIRGQSSGAEHERAQSFVQFAKAFETMVAWQTELGDVGEALAAIEQGRARSLLDEINFSGADLNIGRSTAERAEIAGREGSILAEIAAIEEQLKAATDKEARESIRGELGQARERLYQHYRSERSTNPVYRNLLSVGAGPPRLSQVQRYLAKSEGLLLMYFFGDEAGYLLVGTPDSARVVSLQVDTESAQTLGCAAGPLTAKRLAEVLLREDKSGVVQQLAASAKGAPPTAKLHALWKVLIPPAEQEALLKGKQKRLFVVPDGSLALLPLETLVITPGDNPVYLLDRGPPVLYGPSTTVLYNLAQRAPSQNNRNNKPVLTVGDPVYAVVAGAAAEDEPTDAPPLEARYAGLGRRLTPLPHTGLEVGWVSDVFGKHGINSGKLLKSEATEANVRFNVSGRKIVHLACHGLTDQSYGNFFGALALTPGGPNSQTNNDGFLTLAEIYELDMRGCELAILSACETNFGPQQRGEGVWALSRGFLVAGSRRVVASNWLVDDEAAANLITVFCDGIARVEGKAGQQADYAADLQSAKRWVRKQEKWRSPYYWASFVLVGPE